MQPVDGAERSPRPIGHFIVAVLGSEGPELIGNFGYLIPTTIESGPTRCCT
jgi:hypothetical protein